MKYRVEDIDKSMKDFMESQDMGCGALLVRQDGELVYQGKWGPVDYDSVYRMASNSKVVTAVCVMQLVEQGKVGLDDPVFRFIPSFRDTKVSADDRFTEPLTENQIADYVENLDFATVKTVPAERELTIRDLLSHSSGLGMGTVGLIAMRKDKSEDKTLEQRVDRYAGIPLDFQPGTDTGYSWEESFDTLGRVVEVVSGMHFEDYMQKYLCEPLGMKDTTFFQREDQAVRMAPLYLKQNGKLLNITGTDKDMFRPGNPTPALFEKGASGLLSTVTDYEHFAEMLCNKGNFRGKQILKPETVELIRTEAPYNHLEPQPGMVWGLGVKIRQNPGLTGNVCTEGTYGWSGAFGTHFFVSPVDNLEAVWVTNRLDIGGSASICSKKVEELVFGIWRKNKSAEK